MINHRYQVKRPTSLFTCLSKIFDLLILHRLKYHLVSNNNNNLVNEQFSFQENVSIVSAIVNLTESVISAWENK